MVAELCRLSDELINSVDQFVELLNHFWDARVAVNEVYGLVLRLFFHFFFLKVCFEGGTKVMFELRELPYKSAPIYFKKSVSADFKQDQDYMSLHLRMLKRHYRRQERHHAP